MQFKMLNKMSTEHFGPRSDVFEHFSYCYYLRALMGSLAHFARLCRTVISWAIRQKSAFSDTTTDEDSPVC